MRRAAIFGMGISGKGAAALLESEGIEVVGIDQKVPHMVREEEFDPAGFDLLVVSPGIAMDHPLILRAIDLSIPVLSEAELAFHRLRNVAVGVTGTNGKTTTTRLIEHILTSCGKKAFAVGNIGFSLSQKAIDVDVEEILVMELSSYQLEALFTKRLAAGVILNIAPDHLDRYKTMENYVAAKARMGEILLPHAPLFVSAKLKGEYPTLFMSAIAFEERAPPVLEAYARCGIQNGQAAYAIASSLGIGHTAIVDAMASFVRPEHRIEYVAEKNGVLYYNDSKATNVDSVIYAMEGLEGPILLLAGGLDKGSPYTPWIVPFGSKVKKVFAFGSAREKIAADLKGAVDVVAVETMREAFSLAKGEAVAKDKVLLSPGCSSFDQFRNFEHRGNEFKQMVRGDD